MSSEIEQEKHQDPVVAQEKEEEQNSPPSTEVSSSSAPATTTETASTEETTTNNKDPSAATATTKFNLEAKPFQPKFSTASASTTPNNSNNQGKFSLDNNTNNNYKKGGGGGVPQQQFPFPPPNGMHPFSFPPPPPGGFGFPPFNMPPPPPPGGAGGVGLPVTVGGQLPTQGAAAGSGVNTNAMPFAPGAGAGGTFGGLNPALLQQLQQFQQLQSRGPGGSSSSSSPSGSNTNPSQTGINIPGFVPPPGFPPPNKDTMNAALLQAALSLQQVSMQGQKPDNNNNNNALPSFLTSPPLPPGSNPPPGFAPGQFPFGLPGFPGPTSVSVGGNNNNNNANNNKNLKNIQQAQAAAAALAAQIAQAGASTGGGLSGLTPQVAAALFASTQQQNFGAGHNNNNSQSSSLSGAGGGGASLATSAAVSRGISLPLPGQHTNASVGAALNQAPTALTVNVGNASLAALKQPPKFACIVTLGLPRVGNTTASRGVVKSLEEDGLRWVFFSGGDHLTKEKETKESSSSSSATSSTSAASSGIYSIPGEKQTAWEASKNIFDALSAEIDKRIAQQSTNEPIRGLIIDKHFRGIEDLYYLTGLLRSKGISLHGIVALDCEEEALINRLKESGELVETSTATTTTPSSSSSPSTSGGGGSASGLTPPATASATSSLSSSSSSSSSAGTTVEAFRERLRFRRVLLSQLKEIGKSLGIWHTIDTDQEQEEVEKKLRGVVLGCSAKPPAKSEVLTPQMFHDGTATFVDSVDTYYRVMSSLMSLVRTPYRKYPGTMPKPLSRTVMHDSRFKFTESYYVRRKSEGQKYILFYDGSGLFLVPKHMRCVFQLPDGAWIGVPLKQVSKFVLEGELTRLSKEKTREKYLVHDALAWCERDSTSNILARAPWRERHELLTTRLCNEASAFYSRDNVIIVHQLSVPFNKATQLFEPCDYPTEGICLQPSAQPQRWDAVFLWRTPELVTIDFRLGRIVSGEAASTLASPAAAGGGMGSATLSEGAQHDSSSLPVTPSSSSGGGVVGESSSSLLSAAHSQHPHHRMPKLPKGVRAYTLEVFDQETARYVEFRGGTETVNIKGGSRNGIVQGAIVVCAIDPSVLAEKKLLPVATSPFAADPSSSASSPPASSAGTNNNNNNSSSPSTPPAQQQQPPSLSLTALAQSSSPIHQQHWVFLRARSDVFIATMKNQAEEILTDCLIGRNEVCSFLGVDAIGKQQQAAAAVAAAAAANTTTTANTATSGVSSQQQQQQQNQQHQQQQNNTSNNYNAAPPPAWKLQNQTAPPPPAFGSQHQHQQPPPQHQQHHQQRGMTVVQSTGQQALRGANSQVQASNSTTSAPSSSSQNTNVNVNRPQQQQQQQQRASSSGGVEVPRPRGKQQQHQHQQQRGQQQPGGKRNNFNNQQQQQNIRSASVGSSSGSSEDGEGGVPGEKKKKRTRRGARRRPGGKNANTNNNESSSTVVPPPPPPPIIASSS